MSINTCRNYSKFSYGVKKIDFQMGNIKNLNDLLVNLNPKVLRFTGEKFPSELWSDYSKINKNDLIENKIDI